MEINERTAGGNTPNYVVSGDGVISPIVQCMCESVVSGEGSVWGVDGVWGVYGVDGCEVCGVYGVCMGCAWGG